MGDQEFECRCRDWAHGRGGFETAPQVVWRGSDARCGGDLTERPAHGQVKSFASFHALNWQPNNALMEIDLDLAQHCQRCLAQPGKRAEQYQIPLYDVWQRQRCPIERR